MTSPWRRNVLGQDFVAEAPNQRWVGDTTEFVIGSSGKLYLAAILDLYSRFLVGWAVSAINDRHLVIRALQMALKRRRPARGLLHHSDQGSPYASEDYQQLLETHHMTGSMSRRGNCYDCEHESCRCWARSDPCYDRPRVLALICRPGPAALIRMVSGRVGSDRIGAWRVVKLRESRQGHPPGAPRDEFRNWIIAVKMWTSVRKTQFEGGLWIKSRHNSVERSPSVVERRDVASEIDPGQSRMIPGHNF